MFNKLMEYVAGFSYMVQRNFIRAVDVGYSGIEEICEKEGVNMEDLRRN